MFPIAHVASAMLLNRLLYKDRDVAAPALASLLPDAVDKPLAWVLRVTPSSHYYAHTPLAAAGLTLLVARLWGSRAARAFGSGYLLHLLADDLHHGRVPWLLPFSPYRRLPRRRSPWLLAAGVLGEIPGLALALFLLRSREGAGKGEAAPPAGAGDRHARAGGNDDGSSSPANGSPDGRQTTLAEAGRLVLGAGATNGRLAAGRPASLPHLMLGEAQ